MADLDRKEILRVMRKMEIEAPQDYQDILKLVAQLDDLEEIELARNDFMTFVKRVWPGFIHGHHHTVMAGVFEAFAAGKKSRCTIAMPPRHTKSEFGSYLFPAWFLGKYPDKKIIQASSTSELAVSWGRKVRNLVATEEYQKIFPGTSLRADSKAAGRWNTSKGGEYFAIGAEGALAGRGGDLVILDDVVSEQEAISAVGNPQVFNRIYEWYLTGPRQRLQPGGRILQIATRWALNDLTGRLQRAEVEGGGGNVDRWEIIELPALLPSGEPLWPQFWSKAELERTKNALPLSRWMAQYQQQPTSEASALIKREWWKRWPENPSDRMPPFPKCQYIITSVDTAFTKTETADYSAFTTWGIFTTQNEHGKQIPNLFLLDAWMDRMEFPDLKAAAYKYYQKWKPDSFMVEAKAAGAPLIYELRVRGIPVAEYTPTRGTKAAPNDKIARVNSISDIFASGMVWAPRTKWAEEVIEQVAAFPSGGDHDDLVDATTMAVMRFRQGGFLRLDTDEWDDTPKPRRRGNYY